jgi:hypothetical protein
MDGNSVSSIFERRKMEEEYTPTIFLDPFTRKCIETLTEKSKNLALEMGILMWIYSKRDFGGRFENWTELPISWFAKKSKVGFRKVQEAADNLVTLGIVQQMSPNGKPHVAMRYRFSRPDPRYVKKEQPFKEESKVVNKPVTFEQVKVTPPKAVSIPQTKWVWAWDGEKMSKSMEVSLTEAVNYPSCPVCHRLHVKTDSCWGKHDCCFVCGLQLKAEEGIRYWYGNTKINGKDTTYEEMKEILKIAVAKSEYNVKGGN